MTLHKQQRSVTTPLILDGAKRLWNTPQIIKTELASTEKSASAAELTTPESGNQVGPS